jgi:hypothetical protein
MNIVGLAGAGSRVAKYFEEFEQYKVFYIDHENHGPQTTKIKKQRHPEAYEANPPDFAPLVEQLEDNDIILFVNGASYLSALTLILAETLKNHKITLVYIKPDTSMLNTTKKLNEKVVFNVLQEFTRSGKFERIYLFDNQVIENIIGDLPVIGYWDKINEVIGSTIHMLNVYYNNEPVMGGIEEPAETCRISAVGTKDLKTGEEKLFFSLDNPRESCYIYGINKDKLKESSDLLKNIKEDLKSRLTETLNVSFGIFPTNYDRDIGYVVKHTSFIQNNQRQE